VDNSITYKVLYVEDSQQLADLCVAAMEIHGYDVVTAANCTDGRVQFANGTFDLILLDYNLPDGDGISLAKEFQANSSDIPVVLITAQGSEKVAAEALGAGVSAYVIKSGREVYTTILPNVIGNTIANSKTQIAAKQLQQQVKANEANLQAFLDALKDRAVLIEADGTVLAANEAQGELYGVPLSSLIGENIYELDHPLTAKSRRKRADAVLESGIPAMESGVALADNDKFLEISSYPVSDERGTPVRVAFLSTDVTDQVKMQNSLRESEERFRDFAELGADRFWETDDQFRFTYFSSPVKNLRLPIEKILGKVLWGISGSEKIHPGLIKIKELCLKHEPVNQILFETSYEREDVASIRISAKPMFDETGIFTGYRGSTKDETEEIQAKERAESVERQFFETLENSDIGLALWGPDERLVNYNSQYLKFNSLMAAHIEIGMSYEEFSRKRLSVKPFINSDIPEEEWLADRQKKFRNSNSVREFQRGTQSFELKSQRFDDGSTMMYLTDITDKKHYEEIQRQSLKMEAVGQLTGGIAHDFNNILAALHGNLSLIEIEPSDTEKLFKRLERAKKTVMRGADLTKRLLAFSRKQQLEPVSTDVRSLISDILSMMQRTLGEGINIDMKSSSDLWLALVDVNQLENAILNLVINARDAMAGSGSVKISTFNHIYIDEGKGQYGGLEDGRYVAITVEDSGHGISPDELDKVFDPFYTTKEFGQGSGLGLSMVHGFIIQSGGGIRIESEVGAGTKVIMLLPHAENIITDLEINLQNEIENPIGDESEQKDNGSTVMVIEDDADVREIMVSALENYGYAVVDGGDGREAVEIAKNHQAVIDLLLTDVMLPNGNRGPNLAREIEDDIEGLKVLLMTGYAQENLLSSDEHRYSLIQKPFEINKLISTIDALIQSPK
jgi:PAS domain S-box-containing protein